MRHLVIVGCSAVLIFISPAAAQIPNTPLTEDPAAVWLKIGPLCSADAKKTETPFARSVARAALDEFWMVGGHQIDARGGLFRFGVYESEQEEDSDNGKPRNRDLGWWNVERYWKALDARMNTKRKLKGYLGASTSSSADDRGKHLELPLKTAREKIRELVAETDEIAKLQEILDEAVVRASISDVAWSAAFISYVMMKARQGTSPAPRPLEDDVFRVGPQHIVYVRQALSTSLKETKSPREAVRSLYRACPPDQAMPRAGDMICYHRDHKKSEWETKDRRAGLAKARVDFMESVIKRTDAPTDKLHCDVVVHVNSSQNALKAYVVGGNVQQSVTIKELNLRKEDLTVNEVQPSSCDQERNWKLPEPSAGVEKAPSISKKCSLIDKPWFLLLQHRNP
jgi:hypothetical protein